MGRLKPIPQLKNGGNGLPKTGIGGKNNRTASIPNNPGDKTIGNGSKPQDIAKDMRDKVGEAVKNLDSANEPSQKPENIEEPMPDSGSLIDEMPQQSLAGSLNNPGSLNAGNGGLGGDGDNGKDKNGKKKKTPIDKLKGKVKRAIIQAILSHLMPIFIGVMAFGAIGSCSAAMFTGGDNTEIEQTRGQNKKIVINGSNNDVCADDDSHDSDGNYSLGSENHKVNSGDGEQADEWGKKIFGYYKSKGYSDAAAAAVCGNMFRESHYNTTADNSGDFHGLCQWDTKAGGRYDRLSSWAKENNMDPEDFKAQVEYSEKELVDTYLDKMEGWKDSTNVAEATETYLNIFEGAAGQALQERINNAQVVMDAFSGKVSGSSTLSSSTKSKVCNNKNSSSSFTGDWVYYNQNKAVESWGAPSQGNWGSGCGTVGEAMILSTYAKDKKYNPTWLVDNGWTSQKTVYLSDDASFCKKVNDMQDTFHLKATSGFERGQWKEHWDEVKKTCSNGGAVLLGQDTISATSKAHYIVIQKVENGTVTYANPANGKQETIEESKLLSYGYSQGNTTQTIYFDKI